MKCREKAIVILAVVLSAALLIIMIVPSVAGATTAVNEPTVIGVSHREGNNLFQVAVQEHSRMAFPIINWHVYLPENATVKHLIDGETAWEDNLTAGLHVITLEYEPGSYELQWQIGLLHRADFDLRITTSSAQIIDEEDDNIIVIEPGTINRIEWETGLGCLALALVPSLFMIPYHRDKKEEEIEDVL